jgi:hypothetical protein
VSMTASILRSGVLSMALSVLLVSSLPTSRASAQTNSFKLFDAVPVTPVGPVTHPNLAVEFGQTELILVCPAVPSAIISSDPEGTGSVVVDNFLTVDGRNVCPGNNNCFLRFAGGSSDASLAYTAVPAFDISSSIPSGAHAVSFVLSDHGGLLGSSEIWLVTNCFLWTQRD